MGRLGENKVPKGGEVETTTVGLYDVGTIARISPMADDSSPGKDSLEWKLKTRSNDRFLVLASCSDIAIFNLGETTEYDYTTSLGGTVTDFEILGNSSFCVGIVDKKNVVILSLDKQTAYFNEPSPFEIDFVVCNPTPTVCYLTFGSRSEGRWSTVTMQGDVAASKEHNRLENWQKEQLQDFFQQAMQKAVTKTVETAGLNPQKKIMMVPNGPLQSFFSIGEPRGIQYCGIGQSKFSLIDEELSFVTVQDGGRFILKLDTDGYIQVFDPTVDMLWGEFDVKTSPNQKILDFVVIDKDDVDVPKLFALLIEEGGIAYVVIHDRSKKENSFTLPSADLTTLFSYGGGDRVLMSVEEDDENVVIRQVSQSRPEMRFEALLKSNRFDEAEKFAKTYNLDIQKVYKSHVYYLQDRCDYNDDDFTTLMRTMEMITDHNMVAETYFSLVGMSRRCDRIRTYLSQAKKRKIGDLEILRLIESVSYTWGTYRIITGPENNDNELKLSENVWEMFVEGLHGGDPWVEMYNEFISKSQFTKARVIFSRHGQSIIDYLCLDDDSQIGRLEALFGMFSDAISADIGKWSSVVEHITTDIFPTCLMDLDKLVPCLEGLITTLVPLLEYRDPTNWPDNAIKAASSYDTMAKVLVSNGNTPASQSLFVLQCSTLTRTINGGSSSMSRIKKIFHDLHEIKRLKEVYECSITFSTFQNLTSEGICHKILQNALSNPNDTQIKIEKFVKPFMAERGLDQEETIVNYIQIMSGAAFSKANIFGWEKQCVQLCASLTDETRRFSSVISIASNSKVPWPVELNEAVDKILASRTLSRFEIDEMKMVVKRTELFKMLSFYGYRREDIEILTLPDANMDIINTIRCMLAQKEKTSRFVDVMKLLELLTAMNGKKKCTLKTEFVQSLAVIHMMNDEDVTTSIINHIDSLNERERIKTISSVFAFVEQVADTPAGGQNVEERAKMLGVGEELLSYYACRDNNYDDPESQLRKRLVLLREVQADQKVAVVLSDFKNFTWQKEFLEKLLADKDSLRVKINRCNYMGIPVEYLIEMLLAKATLENDMSKMVESIGIYVDCINPWTDATRDMLDPILQLLSWTTFRLPELSADENDVTRADDIAFAIRKLGRVVRETLNKFSFDVLADDIGYLLQLEAYFTLGDYIIKQSLRGQDNEQDTANASTSVSDLISSSSQTLIFGFKPSLGTYDFSGDPALFEGVSGVLALAQVAPSVARPYQSTITDEDAETFRANWEQLNMFLAMHSQDLLDIYARVFAGSLRCFAGEWRQAVVEIEQPVVTVIERMLQQKKFDLWHAVTLLSGIPAEKIDQTVNDLAKRSGVKSSTKAFIQYLQMAFVMSLAINNTSKLAHIIIYYEQKFLVKKLAEEGIRANITSSDFVDKIVQQAAELRQPLPPYRLHEYVKRYLEKFKGSKTAEVSVGEYMVRYATLLIRKASAAGRIADEELRREEIAKFVELARTSLRIADGEKANCITKYLRCLIYVICPYNYEVIQFMVTSFGQFAVEEDDVEFQKSLKAIMAFLWQYERTNHVSKEESIWFTKRESTLVKNEKEFEKTSRFVEPFGNGMRMAYEEDDVMSETMSTDSYQDELVYEKNSVIISEMPSLAVQHLPFHAFLLRRKEDIDQTVMFIVKSELSIFNVPVWQAYLREVAWLSNRFSRSHLLSTAIFAHASKYAMHGKSLPEGERAAIYQLLNSSNQRHTVIATISLLFKKIMLSEVKIELLQMGVNISEQWLEDMQDDEREEIKDQCDRLKDGIAKFFTELELKKNGMYTEKTADNIENVEELCAHIYDEMIEWSNTSDVAKKSRVVDRIAEANGLDLAVLHEKLVFAWIEDTDSSAIPISHVDMNESIGGTSFIMDQKEDSQDKDEMRMPLFDTVLDKIIILCKRVDKTRLFKRLCGILVKGGRKATGGFTAIVRVVCIIVRFFTDEELQQLNNISTCDICGSLELQLYDRLFDLADVKYDPNVDKVQLIRTLLQCPSRSHPMTSLIACLIIDHEFNDPKSIEQVMTRLQIAKQWNILRALLNYIRSNHMDSLIRSFPLLWFRVYENALVEINGGPMANPNWNYEQCMLLRKWTLWAMSSSVEGGRQPNIARFLREINCPVAASVMSVLCSWTVEKMDEVDVSKMDPLRDICLDWNPVSTTSGNNSIA